MKIFSFECMNRSPFMNHFLNFIVHLLNTICLANLYVCYKFFYWGLFCLLFQCQTKSPVGTCPEAQCPVVLYARVFHMIFVGTYICITFIWLQRKKSTCYVPESWDRSCIILHYILLFSVPSSQRLNKIKCTSSVLECFFFVKNATFVIVM